MNQRLIGGVFIIVACIVAVGFIDRMTTETKNINEQTTVSKEVQVNESSVAADDQQDQVYFGAKAAKNDQTLTTEDMLNYAIEDEYLARREYEMIMNEYGEQRPFSNIIKAEEQHISRLITLLNAYTFSIPKDPSKEIVTMPRSLNDAYQAGVTAEIENIAMYERFLEEDLPTDVEMVFVDLRDASKNHLRAFGKFAR